MKNVIFSKTNNSSDKENWECSIHQGTADFMPSFKFHVNSSGDISIQHNCAGEDNWTEVAYYTHDGWYVIEADDYFSTVYF